MRIKFGDLWRWEGEVGRGTYLLVGLLGFSLKHNLDRALATWVFHRPWGVFNYWISPFDLAGDDTLAQDQRAFVTALLLLALPFVWVGLVMTIRRLRSAGLPPWLAVLFFAPFINLLFFVMLGVLPSASTAFKTGTTPKKSGLAEPWLDSLIPHHPAGSAAAGVLLSGLFSIPLVALTTTAFGAYTAGLFLGLPFCMGLLSTSIFGMRSPRHMGGYLLVSTLSVLFAAGLLLAFAVEGVVCILMAAPTAVPCAWAGALLAYALHRPPKRRETSQVFPALLLALPALMAAEHATLPPPPVYTVQTALEIDAPPETVWRQVVSFAELPPPEELLFRIGIAYPMRAEIEGEGPGAVRHCVFSTGPFVEPIEVWDEPRLLKFSVTDNPSPMEEWTPYQAVHPPHLEGYLVSSGGQFLLERLPGGRTKLEGTTWYRHSLWPAAYWRIWSDAVIHRIHLRVLRHIKGNAEQS
jgi:uncharacterized membrane protein YhaH (DUF805 family)